MRFRFLNVPRIIFQILRSNYAVRSDYDPEMQPMALNYMYKFCLALIWPLKPRLDAFYEMRERWYILCACSPTYGQIERVLNSLWEYQNNEITITPSSAELAESYLYDTDTPAEYWYAEDTPAVYLGRGGVFSEVPIVNVPSALYNSPQYEQFLQELRFLVPFYIGFVVIPY